MEKIWFYHSPLGTLALGEENGYLTCVRFGKEVTTPHLIEKTPLLELAEHQLIEYFRGERKTFRLPITLKGTEFQKKVWMALQKIPYGATASYGELAKEIGNPKGARAVGLANNRNPISIIIPCHRVIGKNGKLVGYGGGLENKVFLLDLEAKYKN